MNKIKLVTNQEEINQLYNFIKKYPLEYPRYLEWLLKCKRELELGIKKGLICTVDEEIVANLIFQRHKQDPLTVEIKNIRVKEEYRNLGIFTSLLKETEKYASENRFKRIIVDTHDEDVVAVLTKLGFKIESKESLYLANRKEIILAKDLNSLESKLV